MSPASLAESADATQVTVKAELDGGALTSNVVVTLSVGSASTAVRDTDYTAPATLGDGTSDITITMGQTSAEVTLSIDPTQDTFDEGTGETIVISGVATGGLTTTETATLTIRDDDTLNETIQLSFNPTTVRENETPAPPR